MANRTHADSDVKAVENGWTPTGVVVNRGRRYFAVCVCQCGARGEVSLRTGGILSTQRCHPCAMKVTKGNRKHGNCGNYKLSPTYASWSAMWGRCIYPSVEGYENYGGRGITVSERWASFENFLADMGERPNGSSIDRIDNDGNYEPGNCRWATRREQQRNTGRCHPVTFSGRTMTLVEWQEELGLTGTILSKRLRAGWSVEQALTRPPRRRSVATREPEE